MRFRVTGCSMWPAIRGGDVLELEPCTQPSPGDVVLCLTRGEFVVHRCLGREDGKLVTQGDALQFPDGPLLPSAVLGKVVSREPAAWPWRILAWVRRAYVVLLFRLKLAASAVWLDERTRASRVNNVS